MPLKGISPFLFRFFIWTNSLSPEGLFGVLPAAAGADPADARLAADRGCPTPGGHSGQDGEPACAHAHNALNIGLIAEGGPHI